MDYATYGEELSSVEPANWLRSTQHLGADIEAHIAAGYTASHCASGYISPWYSTMEA